MARDGTVMQVRLDERLKQDFLNATEREHTTPSKALRAMVEDFIRQSRRREAERQSRLVAEAEDADAVMAEVMAAQGFHGD